MKTGDLLYFKSTGEPCVVLESDESGVLVNRPVVVNDTEVTFRRETFLAYELETAQEKFSRETANQILKFEIALTAQEQVEAIKAAHPSVAGKIPANLVQ